MDIQEQELRAWYDFRLHCWLDPDPRTHAVNTDEEDWEDYAEWVDRQGRWDYENTEADTEDLSNEDD